MLDPLVLALIRHRNETADQPNPHGLVWHNDGAPIRPGDDQAEWRAILATIGLPPEVTTHWARHAVSTLLMEAGVDAKVVGEIIGHSDVQLTRGTYQHVSTDLARQGIQKLGTLLALDG
jgi:site-specific recombinase XerD